MIASCAIPRSVLRRSKENSGVTAGSQAASLPRGSSDGLDIAFSPLGQDKSPATPLFRFMIDPRPEGNEVVQGGNQRKQNHEPDGDSGDPINREEINVEQWPFLPAASENHRHHRNNLHQHFELAEFARLNRKTFGRGNRAQPAHQKLAADDNHGHPCRYQRRIELHQGDESGSNQQFVSQRIEQDAHGRDLAPFSRQVTIDSVGYRSHNKNGRSQNFPFASALAGKTGSTKNPY